MQKFIKILKYGLIFFLVSLFISTGCVAARQNPFNKKRSKASHVNTSTLGRNKYYFSTGYQKKLLKTFKK
jgi:hypothetical protein